MNVDCPRRLRKRITCSRALTALSDLLLQQPAEDVRISLLQFHAHVHDVDCRKRKVERRRVVLSNEPRANAGTEFQEFDLVLLCGAKCPDIGRRTAKQTAPHCAASPPRARPAARGNVAAYLVRTYPSVFFVDGDETDIFEGRMKAPIVGQRRPDTWLLAIACHV